MKWKYIIWGIYEVKCQENSNLLHIGSKSYDMKYSIVTDVDVECNIFSLQCNIQLYIWLKGYRVIYTTFGNLDWLLDKRRALLTMKMSISWWSMMADFCSLFLWLFF